MRKLAREAVIFCLFGMLVTGSVELVLERGEILTAKANLYAEFGGTLALDDSGIKPPPGFHLDGKAPAPPAIEPCKALPDGIEPIPAGALPDDLTPRCVMDGKIIKGFSNSMCEGILGTDGSCSQLSAEGAAAETKAPSQWAIVAETPIPKPKLSWEDTPRLAYAFGVLGFLIGFPIGFGVWIFYRLIRFAALG